MGLYVVPVEPLQHLGDLRVKHHPARGGKLIQQRLLDQGMGELIPSDRPRQLLDDAGPQGLFEDLQQAGPRQVFDERLYLVDPELAPDHGRDG